jgi:hypothetical protein
VVAMEGERFAGLGRSEAEGKKVVPEPGSGNSRSRDSGQNTGWLLK